MIPLQHPDVEREVLEAIAYYESKRAGLGREFYAELRHAYSVIGSNPRRWPKVGRRVRRYLLHRFPYRVIYMVLNDAAYVVAVAHGSRRDYWRNRAP